MSLIEKKRDVDSNEESYGGESNISFKSISISKEDYRVLWIQERIITILDLSDAFDIFNQLMHSNNEYYQKKLDNFLNSDIFESIELELKQVFFYKTYRDEVVQDEISVWEKRCENIEELTSSSSQVKSQRLVKNTSIGRKKKKKKMSRDRRQSKENVSATDNNESITALQHDLMESGSEEYEDEEENGSTGDIDYNFDDLDALIRPKDDTPLIQETVETRKVFIPPPSQRHKYVLRKKLVDRLIRVPVLHCFFGAIDGNDNALSDQQIIYFLRSKEEPIPSFKSIEESNDELPRHILVGSIQGQFLNSMSLLLKDVFLPLIENQFRGPEAAQDKVAKEVMGSMMATPGIEKAAETLSDLTKSQGAAFMPPSNIRRISLLAEKRQSEEDNLLPSESKDQTFQFMTDSKSKKSIEEAKLSIEPSKTELLQYLQTLIDSIEWTIDHVEADIMLIIPDVIEVIDPRISEKELSKHRKLIEQLEEIVLSWERHIRKVLDSYMNKPFADKSPMAEYLYWHDCESGMSLIVEQLKSQSIVKIFKILNFADSAIAVGFNFFAQELYDFYNTSKDNNKFLSTMLRYFKVITESTSFVEIKNAIPQLYEHLKMIWILSKHYSQEERIIPLFEKISWQLRQNFMKNLKFKELFNESLETILIKTETAHNMMKEWKSCYLSTRIDIEFSGKGVRWEFDQRRLFKDTDYLAEVSENLNEIFVVLRDFYNIFGEELKSIVDDPARIDNIVERVDSLLGPIKNAEHDAFNELNRDNWDATMTWFRSEVKKLEQEAGVFIDDSFKSLICAEEALLMLIKFKSLNTRKSVQHKLSMKFDVIMQQFSKEVNEVEKNFNRSKRNPPLLRYHAPISGAIFWERQLFHRMKKSIVMFQEIDELKDSELRKFAFEQYVSLAETMKLYEDNKFNDFINKVQPTLLNSMRFNILTLQPYKRKIARTPTVQARTLRITSSKKMGSGDYASNSFRGDALSNKSSFDVRHKSSNQSLRTLMSMKSLRSFQSIRPSNTERKLDAVKPMRLRSSTSLSAERFQQKSKKNLDLTRGVILLENQMKLAVNFNQDIFHIIREAELMDQLGFNLPKSVREIAIQKIRLHVDYESVENMIKQYNDIIDKFDEADILLLKNTLEQVEKQIQPGLTRLNWNSLNIIEYSSKCCKLLKNLTSMVTQINQIRRDLDDKIDTVLGRYNLFTTKDDPNDPDYQLRTCKIFFTEIEHKRTDHISVMLKNYQTISPMLIKLESLVEGTATGRSTAMILFYEYYEQKIFTAFISCFVRNLDYFKNMICGNKAMFQVNATIISTDAILQPTAHEVFTIIMRDVKDLMDRTKVFSRWMIGTSIECRALRDEVTAEYINFSYFEDLMNIQIINELIFMIQDKAQRLSQDCSRYLQKWKIYNSLWSVDKKQACTKFAATNNTLQSYIEKFSFYESIIDEINDMPDYHDICSVRINIVPIKTSIKEHAMEWKQILGNHLHTDTSAAMQELKDTIDKFRSEVELVINGLERFKLVMQCIANIKSKAVESEVKYLQYQETFRILRSIQIEFPESEEIMAYSLTKEWESLYHGALYRFSSLESTKDQFRDMSIREIEEFKQIIEVFVEKFHKDGPGTCGEDMEDGIEKMEEFGHQIYGLKERLEDLKNAELLFDLPGSDYTEFYAIERDYNSMIKIFKMYKTQKMARDIWAKTLWENLDPQELINGMDNFLKDFRKFPPAVRNLGIARNLENKMKDFKNSVPLFVELKNEAMRERHWKELMDRTGKHFDMSPDRFAK